MKALFFSLLLLAGCTGPGLQPSADPPSHKLLLIVSPPAWWDSVSTYIELKREQGYGVLSMDTDLDPEKIKQQIDTVRPDYVFLIGDGTNIPTVYHCQNEGTPDEYCLYSDSWLSSTHVPIGRLLASQPVDVDQYVLLTAAYKGRGLNHRSYVINDRAYDAHDSVALQMKAKLALVGDVAFDVLNPHYDPYVMDDAGVATGTSLSLAVDSEVDFIQYYGHGGERGLGYNLNIHWYDLHFHESRVIPLMFAAACQTDLQFPNPPFYYWQGEDGNAMTFPPAATQPPEALVWPFGWYLTGHQAAGAMVYIGETKIQPPNFGILNRFYTALLEAYSTPTTIGDIWKDAAGSDDNAATYQLLGDPSTPFGSW